MRFNQHSKTTEYSYFSKSFLEQRNSHVSTFVLGSNLLFIQKDINKKIRRQKPADFGAPEGTRTPDPLIRSQVLYPAELLAHID